MAKRRRGDEDLKILDLNIPGLYESNDKMIRGTFRDFTEWVKAATADAPEGSWAESKGGIENCLSHDQHRDNWAGTKSYAEAVKQARVGWPAGLLEVQKFVVKFESLIAGLLPIPEIVFDVSGDYLDIGRFLSGEPEDFASLRDSEDTIETSNAKIVRIGLNMATSAGFDVSVIQRRGAACVALMHMLELTGRSCSLDVVEATTNHRRQESYIAVKRAGETLSPEQIAFAAVSGSMLRRFRFAVNEKYPSDIAREVGCDYGYGSPAQVLKQEDYDVYLPALMGYGGAEGLGDDDSAIQWVLQTLKEQGVPITEKGR